MRNTPLYNKTLLSLGELIKLTSNFLATKIVLATMAIDINVMYEVGSTFMWFIMQKKTISGDVSRMKDAKAAVTGLSLPYNAKSRFSAMNGEIISGSQTNMLPKTVRPKHPVNAKDILNASLASLTFSNLFFQSTSMATSLVVVFVNPNDIKVITMNKELSKIPMLAISSIVKNFWPSGIINEDNRWPTPINSPTVISLN